MALRLFSFGYWGWGNHTAQLVQAVGAVEAARGFAPPGFVDTRIRRAVRAAGFQGAAFERLLGPERHRWMPALGNRHVVTNTGPPIQIAEPAAAGDLLDLAVEWGRRRQRVLYFCACEWMRVAGETACHRDAVGDLVLAEAARRGAAVEVVEWPGGEPTPREMDVEAKVLRAVAGGRATVPLGEAADLATGCGLAWGSVVTLRAAGRRVRVLAGPARYHPSGWALPVLELLDAGLADDAVVARARAFRAARGLLPRTCPG